MTRRRRGRPYQPYPARTTNWAARLVIVAIGFIMVIGIAVLAGILAGLYPAWRIGHAAPASYLKVQ